MKKKFIIGILILFGIFITYKICLKVYRTYLLNQITERVEKRSDIKDFIIVSNGKSDLKVNDLIFVCELRQALWDTDVDVDTIQILAEKNSVKYKNFSEKMYRKILSDEDLKKYSFDNTIDYKKSDVIGALCTLINPDTQDKRSVYHDLLMEKYQTDTGLIGAVDSSKITQEDLKEYQKAMLFEEKLRMQF